MIFTQEQINEIKKRLSLLGTKDTEFEKTHDLTGGEQIPIIQDGYNKLLPMQYLLNNYWYANEVAGIQINTLQELLNQYYSTMQNAISFKGDIEVIPAGETRDVGFTFDCISASGTVMLDIYRDGVQVAHHNATSFPYYFTISNGGTGLYRCEADVNGIKYVGLWDIKESYDFWIGTGVDYNTVLANPSYKHVGASSLSGTYFLNSNENDYIFIICRSNVVPASITMSGFEVPLSIAETITVGGVEYSVYQSANTYQQGSIEIKINDIQYDTDSYIAHLIEEILSLKAKAEGTEEEIRTIADEETITVTENNKVALKNRPMKKSATTGEVIQKGYVILRETDDFKAVVESYTNGHVIFEINYAFDLGGQSVNIPEGCTLKFEGGQISNGILVGSNTSIIGNTYHVFGNGLSFSGEWVVPDIDTDMFVDLSGNNDLQKLFALSSDAVANTIHIRKYDYDYYVYVEDVVTSEVNKRHALVPNANDTVIIDGTIRLVPNASQTYAIIYVNKENVTLMGAGSLIGDALGHTYTNYGTQSAPSTHQWGHIISVGLSNSTSALSLNLEIKGLTLSYGCGDGVALGCSSNINIHDIEIHHCRRQGISVVGGDYVNISNCNIHDIWLDSPLVSGLGIGTLPGAGIDIEPNKNYYPCSFVTVKDCHVENCKQGILVVKPENTYVKNVTISGCVVKDAETHPFYNSACENVICKECTFICSEPLDPRPNTDIVVTKSFDTLFENNTITNYAIDFTSANYNARIISNKIVDGRIAIANTTTFDTSLSNKTVIKGNNIHCPFSNSSELLTRKAGLSVYDTVADITDNVIYGNVHLGSSNVEGYVRLNLTDIVKGNVIQGSISVQRKSAIISGNTISDFDIAGLLYGNTINIDGGVDGGSDVTFTDNVIRLKHNADSKIQIMYINKCRPLILNNTICVEHSIRFVYVSKGDAAKGFIHNDKIVVSDGVTLEGVTPTASSYSEAIPTKKYIDDNEIVY